MGVHNWSGLSVIEAFYRRQSRERAQEKEDEEGIKEDELSEVRASDEQD